jgi:hypothetical protein
MIILVHAQLGQSVGTIGILAHTHLDESRKTIWYPRT